MNLENLSIVSGISRVKRKYHELEQKEEKINNEKNGKKRKIEKKVNNNIFIEKLSNNIKLVNKMQVSTDNIENNDKIFVRSPFKNIQNLQNSIKKKENFIIPKFRNISHSVSHKQIL